MSPTVPRPLATSIHAYSKPLRAMNFDDTSPALTSQGQRISTMLVVHPTPRAHRPRRLTQPTVTTAPTVDNRSRCATGCAALPVAPWQRGGNVILYVDRQQNGGRHDHPFSMNE